MRRVILAVLLVMLAALVAARGAAERPAVQTAAMDTHWYADAYNVLEQLEPPQAGATAGSTLLTELDGWFFSRTPTAKGDYTGLLAGRDLVVLLAEGWDLSQVTQVGTPALWRLRSEGICFQDVYAPDWYQGQDGRQFALLSGMVPTSLDGTSAMAWVGQQSTYLPFSLGTCLGRAGYDCRVYPDREGREASYRALGLTPCPRPEDDAEALIQFLPALHEDSRPFAAVFVMTGRDGERTMDRLWQTLDQTGMGGGTLVCLFTGGGDLRGSLTLWCEGLPAQSVPGPCSELDVTATVLDLLGAAYDARFLSGRDLLAPGLGDRPVSLGGSAYAGWVSDAGVYDASQERFDPADDRFSAAQETARYVQQMRRTVYEQYIFARQVLQCNYFRTRIER